MPWGCHCFHYNRNHHRLLVQDRTLIFLCIVKVTHCLHLTSHPNWCYSTFAPDTTVILSGKHKHWLCEVFDKKIKNALFFLVKTIFGWVEDTEYMLNGNRVIFRKKNCCWTFVHPLPIKLAVFFFFWTMFNFLPWLQHLFTCYWFVTKATTRLAYCYLIWHDATDYICIIHMVTV